VYELLNQFVIDHDLKLNVCSNIPGDEYTLTDELNVDLIISFDSKKKTFVLKGKKSSILIDHLKEASKELTFVEVVGLKDGGQID
jgi:hypothetical protein